MFVGFIVATQEHILSLFMVTVAEVQGVTVGHWESE